jgi:hypothetical protein
MIEFQESIIDINNATVWDVLLGERKIGTLRKEEQTKTQKGRYYLSVLSVDYVIPLSGRKIIPKVVQGAIDSLEADIIMQKVEHSEWFRLKMMLLKKQYET